MLKTIRYCFESKKCLSIYANCDDTEKHLTGFISGYNDNEILISHINSRGDYDGFILIHVGDIFQIDYDRDYEKKFIHFIS